LSGESGKPKFSAHAQVLFDRAISFIDTPRKFWPIVQKLYRWVLRLGGGQYKHIAHYNLGRALHEDGKYEKAAEHYRRAIELKPDYYKAYNNLGIVLCLMGRYEESEAAYRQALEIKDYFNPHNNLADLFLRMGKLDEAKAEVLIASNLEPDSIGTTITYAQILVAMKRFDQAEERYLRALALDSAHIEALENYAELLVRQERLKKADKIFSKARGLKAMQKQEDAGLLKWSERSREYIEQRKGE
jgi:Tfp pilus assembly protein PilF